MASGPSLSTGLAATPMETGNQSVVHYDAGPKQLMFGPHGAGQHQAVSPKKLAQRVVVPAPTDSPDMDQKRLVGEVHPSSI